MEAMRILKALGIQPRRAIRIALWGGEEQGYYGSQNYVKADFGDPGPPEQDLQQAAVIIANFVSQTVLRNEMLPRTSLPKPAPKPCSPIGSREIVASIGVFAG
jgi:hypothetical protein